MENIQETATSLTYQVHFIFIDFGFMLPLVIGASFYLVSFYNIRFTRGNIFSDLQSQMMFQKALGVILVLISIGIFLVAPFRNATFDKSQNNFILRTGNRVITNTENYSLNDVSSVSIKRGYKTRSDYEYSMFVNLKNGQQVQIAHDVEYESYNNFSQEGQQIAAFLGVQFSGLQS